jgi:glycosyltransferase involved in cell wall biosynthesis
MFHNLVSGGAKRSVYEYTRALSRRGHEIDLYTLNSREKEFLSVNEYVNKVSVNDFSPLLSLGDHTFLLSPLRSLELKRLRKITQETASEINKGNYDITFVHSSMYIQCPMVMWFIKDIPTIYYCHETFRFLTEDHPQLSTARDRLRQILLTFLRPYMKPVSSAEKKNIVQADMILTNSDFTRENLFRTYGLNAQVCYQGVDTDRFAPSDCERDNMVMSVGQLTRWKAQDFLVKSISHLSPEIRPTLVLVHDKRNSNYFNYLKNLAVDRGVDLLLKQGITDVELIQLYNRSRAFVYAPVREPFGLVPLEAMACGTPVVAVLEGGVKEVVRKESGGFGVKRDSVEFARVLKDILVSEELRGKTSKRSRSYVLSYWTWEKAAERLEEKIESLLSRS